jgi:hypothetical protein
MHHMTSQHQKHNTWQGQCLQIHENRSWHTQCLAQSSPWGSFCVKFICISAQMTIRNCQLHDFFPHCNYEMYHLQDTTSIQSPILSTSSTHIFVLGASCATTWNVCGCQKQEAVICLCSFMDNTQLFCFLEMTCGWVVQFFTTSKLCLNLAHPWRHPVPSMKMTVVIHAFLFVLYFTGRFLCF